MNILILNNAYYKIESYLYQSARLKEELEKLGATVTVKANDFFPTILNGETISTTLKNFDACIYLDKDKYVSEMIEKSGLKLFNSHRAMTVCDDKTSTYIALSGSGVKMPKTLSGLLCYVENAEIKPNTIDKIEAELGYPLVVKESFGSLGKGVYKAVNRQNLIELMNKVKLKPHHFQKFISSSFGKDVRVICVGGKVVCSMVRTSKTDFRSNVELGGVGSKFDLPIAFKETAERVAQVLELDYCGIDLLFGENNQPIVCEVNSNAFFGGIERVTGVNVAKAFSQHVLNQLK